MIVTEYKIVDIIEGTDVWKGYAKNIILQFLAKSDEHPEGINFMSTIWGDETYLMETFENRARYIGGEALLEFPFYNYTNTGHMVPTMGRTIQLYPNPKFVEPEVKRIDLRDVRKVFENIGRVP